ncbi:MAG: hypothetical protein AAF937_05170 [Planctomycetota bacterium]
MTYARARLWLGMVTVAVFVSASSLLLLFEIPEFVLGRERPTAFGDALGLAVFVGAYAAAHVTSDVVGALLIPAAFGRLDRRRSDVLLGLVRGIVLHSLGLWVISLTLLFAARTAGLLGVLCAAFLVSIALLALRPSIAQGIGRLRRVPGESAVFSSADRGFTGGIDGVIAARSISIPRVWQDTLEADELDAVLGRRKAASVSGAFVRGRIGSLMFTLSGVAVAGLLVGSAELGTAEGIVRLSLWFTLWSFVGLLVLPTLSRRAIARADAECGMGDRALDALAKVDRLGDDEGDRPAIIETIFHPVPAIDRRSEDTNVGGTGFWDIARMSLYLSAAGLGLLGRAVHCNAGRPELWAYLPSA